MNFKQHKSITTELKSPFWLSKVPKALNQKTTRKKFTCGYRALTVLQSLKLNPETYYGADVCDDNGVVVAELE